MTKPLKATDIVVAALALTGGLGSYAGTPTNSPTAERIRLQSLSPTISRSSIQWVNYLGTPLWVMGNDYYLSNHNSFYIYDWTENKYILRSFNGPGGASNESLLSFGPASSSGGLNWDYVAAHLKLVVSGIAKVYIESTAMHLETGVAIRFSSTGLALWSSTTSPGGAVDLGIGRSSADMLEVNNGALGTLRDLAVRELRVGSTTGPRWLSSLGDPNGVVPAPVGSLYTRTDGGAGSTLYVKESGGTGNTGWVAK